MPNKKTEEREQVLQRPINILFLCYQAHGNIDNNWLLMEMMVMNACFFVSV